MPTNLAIDDNLLNLAKKIGKHKTKRAAVNEALQEYIQRRKQFEITKMFGKVEYDKDYDYKNYAHLPLIGAPQNLHFPSFTWSSTSVYPLLLSTVRLQL